MGIQDVNLKLSNAQAVTASAVSTNTIDLGLARDVAEGEPLFLECIVTTAAFTTCASIEMQAITSAAAALTSPTVIGSSGAIPVASLGKPDPEWTEQTRPVAGEGKAQVGDLPRRRGGDGRTVVELRTLRIFPRSRAR